MLYKVTHCTEHVLATCISIGVHTCISPANVISGKGMMERVREGGDHIPYHGFILIFLTALYSPNGGTGQHGKRGAK